jgi:hypothetical protein
MPCAKETLRRKDMDTTILGLVAFALQFSVLAGAISILNCRVRRIEKAKCRCCSQAHPLLDPVNV